MAQNVALIMENGKLLVTVELGYHTTVVDPDALLDKYAKLYAIKRDTLSFGGTVALIPDPRKPEPVVEKRTCFMCDAEIPFEKRFHPCDKCLPTVRDYYAGRNVMLAAVEKIKLWEAAVDRIAMVEVMVG